MRRLGGEIVLHGTSVDDARQHAEALAASSGMTFVHPYDDPDVIAGQGTIAMEILRQHNEDIDAIFVAVGGGGLIAGIAAYVKSLWPKIEIIGVAKARSMQAASSGSTPSCGVIRKTQITSVSRGS